VALCGTRTDIVEEVTVELSRQNAPRAGHESLGHVMNPGGRLLRIPAPEFSLLGILKSCESY
jgi:hypothetical protein